MNPGKDLHPSIVVKVRLDINKSIIRSRSAIYNYPLLSHSNWIWRGVRNPIHRYVVDTVLGPVRLGF